MRGERGKMVTPLRALPAWLMIGSRAWWWVGWVLALWGLTGLDEAGGVEAGVDRLAVGKPVGDEPVPVLLAGQGGDGLSESLEVSAGHGGEPTRATAGCQPAGLVGGGSASEGDVPRAVVEAVADRFGHLVINVARVHLVAHVAFKAVETLLDSMEAVVQRFAHVGRFGFQHLGGHGGESLRDGFPHDGREGVLEGLGESLREQGGEGVGHGGVGWVGCWCP